MGAYSMDQRKAIGYTKFTVLFSAIALILAFLGIVGESSYLQADGLPTASECKRPTIVLDAGHGGEDGGACTYGGLSEKELNLLIATDLYELLSASGINVIMTRQDDRLLYDPSKDYTGHKKSMDLAERLRIACSTPDAILISIHMNAFPEAKYKGLQVYHSTATDSSRLLATVIQGNTSKFIDPENTRKVKAAGKNIYLLDRFQGTGVLIECGFLSNPEERALLNDKDYRARLAFSLFCSILQYIDGGGV
jgi:N-acetylmuramoyl-L-alanine amidase